MTDEPRRVRRARARLVRYAARRGRPEVERLGGRKGHRAMLVIARHEAEILNDERAQARGEDRARDRRNGVIARQAVRLPEERAKEKVERRARRRRAAAL